VKEPHCRSAQVWHALSRDVAVYTPTRLSTNGINHTCLRLPSRSWPIIYQFRRDGRPSWLPRRYDQVSLTVTFDACTVDVRLPFNVEELLQNICVVLAAVCMVVLSFPWFLLALLPLAAVFLVIQQIARVVMREVCLCLSSVNYCSSSPVDSGRTLRWNETNCLRTEGRFSPPYSHLAVYRYPPWWVQRTRWFSDSPSPPLARP